MTKTIKYKGKSYVIEIKWCGSSYGVKCIESNSGFEPIPPNCIEDIEKVKPYIIQAIVNNHDLKSIELWDGEI